MTTEIPVELIQLERIYGQCNLQHAQCLAVTSPERQTGVSLVSLALAKRASMDGKRCLLVDANLENPSLTNQLHGDFIDKDTVESSIQASITDTPFKHLDFLPAPISSQFALQFRNGLLWKNCFQQWKGSYDFIVVDCSSVNSINNKVTPPEIIASSAEKYLFMVLTGDTSEQQVSSAMDKLNQQGATLLGAVMNDQFHEKFADELLKSNEKLGKIFPRIANKLKRMIKKSAVINTEL